MGGTAGRRPPRRPAAVRTHPARPLPIAGHRRGRLHPVRTRSSQPVLPARVVALRTSVGDRHLQQTVRPLGRGVRRRRRGRSHDRPPRPSRRSDRPKRRFLPHQRPRPRASPGIVNRRMNTRGSIFNRRKGVNFRPPLTPPAPPTSLRPPTCIDRRSASPPVPPHFAPLVTTRDNLAHRQPSHGKAWSISTKPPAFPG